MRHLQSARAPERYFLQWTSKQLTTKDTEDHEEREEAYIIAVGGAGSLGSPALESGRKIIKAANPIITARPVRYEGWLKNCGLAHAGANCKPAQTRPSTASPAISPEAVSTPAFSTRAFCASLKPRRCAAQLPTDRKTPPRKIAKVVSNGRYMPTATNMGLRTCIMIIEIPKRMPTTTKGQGI